MGEKKKKKDKICKFNSRPLCGIHNPLATSLKKNKIKLSQQQTAENIKVVFSPRLSIS